MNTNNLAQMKALKIFLLSVMTLIVFLIGALFVVTTQMQNKVARIALENLNKRLVYPAKVESIELTILETFPFPSVSLKNVEILGRDKKNLFKGENLYAQIGFWELTKGKVNIVSIEAKNGALRLTKNKKGIPNYDIFISTKEDTTSADFNIAIKEAVLQNIDIFYQDISSDITTQMKAKNLNLSGNFTNEALDLQIQLENSFDFIELNKIKSLIDIPLSLQARLALNTKNKKYEVDNGKLTINKSNIFEIDGFYEEQTNGNWIDFDIDGKEINVQRLLGLFPKEYLDQISFIEGDGDITLVSSIKGFVDKNRSPVIDAKFKMINGYLSHVESSEKLENLSLELDFNNKNGAAKKGRIEVKTMKGEFQGNPIQGTVAIENLENPSINGYLDGTIDIKTIYRFLSPEISDADGIIEVKDFRIAGLAADMTKSYGMSRVDVSGSATFKDVSFVYKDEKVAINDGNIALKDNDIKISNVSFEGLDTKVTFNGDFLNALPVILADSTKAGQEKLKFKANIEIPSFNLTKWQEWLSADPEKSEENEKATVQATEGIRERKNIASLLEGELSIKMDKFTWKKVIANNMTADFVFAGQTMNINKLYTEGIGGAYSLNGSVDFTDKPILKAKGSLKNIDTKEFLRQFDNFGQTYITDKNLTGMLSSELDVQAFWDAKGNFLMNNLSVKANNVIKDGMLSNVDVLEDALSKIVKQKDLKKVKFNNLENQLIIENGRIFIPTMFVQSNALNFWMTGYHGFDNSFDYMMKVNAAQLVGSLLKSHDDDLTPLEDKSSGKLNVFCRINGDVKNYKVKIGKKGVKEYFDGTKSITDKVFVDTEQLRIDLQQKHLEDIPQASIKQPTVVSEGGKQVVMSKENIPELIHEVEDEPEYLD